MNNQPQAAASGKQHCQAITKATTEESGQTKQLFGRMGEFSSSQATSTFHYSSSCYGTIESRSSTWYHQQAASQGRPACSATAGKIQNTPPSNELRWWRFVRQSDKVVGASNRWDVRKYGYITLDKWTRKHIRAVLTIARKLLLLLWLLYGDQSPDNIVGVCDGLDIYRKRQSSAVTCPTWDTTRCLRLCA